MGSLLDEIGDESRPQKPTCSVAAILDSLDPAERADLQAALDDQINYTHSAICRVLNRRGFDMKQKRLAIHRKGECACTR
jgi:hypothetical protein